MNQSSDKNNNIHIFGIRHHGPGSARSLLHALNELKPDIILVEGPPDANDLLPLAKNIGMQPPVAIIVYIPDSPNQCVFYPFASFSPEWQGIQYALQNNIPVRFMDLPQYHQLSTPSSSEGDNREEEMDVEQIIRDDYQRDPLKMLAEAAGYNDGERWWNHMVEQRVTPDSIFDAILEAMTALRSEVDQRSPITNTPEGIREAQREAFMRQTIRSARKEGYGNIAVVCGAWHAPMLNDQVTQKQDKMTLEGLPKTKTSASWIPWTYSRLSYLSGYGAGIESPGWYDHLWRYPDNPAVTWLTRIAHLLREQDIDSPPASVIEAVRLSESLAALRGRPMPGLPELNEATQTVLTFGSDLPLRVISQKLIIGDILGSVPDECPAVPLMQDLQRLQKRLRLAPDADWKSIDLDLRKDNDREKSELLHRLALLGIKWGKPETSYSSKGTFHELWRIQWMPEYAVRLIEMGVWGNTVEEASQAYTVHRGNGIESLPELTPIIEQVLKARMPDALKQLMIRLDTVASGDSDIGHMMQALPSMANILRYGDVRETDTSMVAHTVDALAVRICIGLPAACNALDEDAAGQMIENVDKAHSAFMLLQNEEHLNLWYEALFRIVEREATHGLVAGRATRILLDSKILSSDDAEHRISFALSTATEPEQAGAWIEGFLRGSGLLLIHDRKLWNVIDSWVCSLHPDSFTAIVPLLRRTFAEFAKTERRQLGEMAREGQSVPTAANDEDDNIDVERASHALPYAFKLLGINIEM